MLLRCRLVAIVELLVHKCNPPLAVHPQVTVLVGTSGLEEEDAGLLGGTGKAGGDGASGRATCARGDANALMGLF